MKKAQKKSPGWYMPPATTHLDAIRWIVASPLFPEFPPLQRVLFVHLMHANGQHGGTHRAGRTRMAELAAMSPKRFRTVEAELIAMGLVSIESEGGPGKGSNAYRVTPFAQGLRVHEEGVLELLKNQLVSKKPESVFRAKKAREDLKRLRTDRREKSGQRVAKLESGKRGDPAARRPKG